jgi:hypothetical protein
MAFSQRRLQRGFAGSGVLTAQITYDLFYEPYAVMAADTPQFSDLFVGYGHDKAELYLELDAIGTRLRVLPDVFLVHVTLSYVKLVERRRWDYITGFHSAWEAMSEFLLYLQVSLGPLFE